jgi:hypothetical protein
MDFSLPREDASGSVAQEFPTISWNTKVHYRVHGPDEASLYHVIPFP